MQLSPKDAVSVNDVLSDALQMCSDEDYRNGFTRGFYVSTIQRGLEELGFDTFFQLITEDIDLDGTDFATSFQLQVPCNMFNIREIYLFNGSCEQPQSIIQVYWKRLQNNGKGGSFYTAKRLQTGTTNGANNTSGNNVSVSDPFQPSSFINSNVYTANIENGIMMFSNNCKGYKWLRIVGNGMGSAIGDMPVIPRFFRTVLSDYVCEKYFRFQMSKDRAYQADWKTYDHKLNNPVNGTWVKAEKRVKRLDTWMKDTVNETAPLWASQGGWVNGGY